jgi:hypothetical protein
MRLENKSKKPKAVKTPLCACTHATHFLGRCRKRVKPPAEQCTECLQDHTPFTRVSP